MIARKWVEYCSDSEWGNGVMWQIAKERFAADATLDVVEVYEHAGWFLAWNRDGQCVGTANDSACFPESVIRWWLRFDDVRIVGHSRRGPDGGEYKHENYYPCVAQGVAA